MSLAEKQRALIEGLSVVPDPQERLSVLTARAARRPRLSEDERTEANRVRGCASQVWIAAVREGEQCHFRSEADSPLVAGLVALLCDFYDGAAAEDVAATEPVLLEELGIWRNLSPTRQNGLQSVRRWIRAFALGETVPRE